eukprot:TRINITY_DN1492_c0_g1_i9.p1 TRINITY_DN1492_c0_g1~~TRINITY_DN1492_c0_g1_i9.p1  ORF type:complete len:311 (-),score=50.06 TRINITY_DN1492_c0_g1_i9:119-1051(-)
MVVHLGDVYYSGTVAEQHQFLIHPLRQAFTRGERMFAIPGNHDYYSGGQGMKEVLKSFNQTASYFCLRNEHWQILALDTGVLDSFNLVSGAAHPMPFLPDDQLAWALHQIQVGQEQGLKTIVMSHHQFFSRRDSVGVANAGLFELATLPDQLRGTFVTSEWWTKNSSQLPGHLPEGVAPAANTRLLDQFNQSVREYVSAFYWGHEHTHSIFKPYAGIKRGRLIGNGCIPVVKDYDVYGSNPNTQAAPWGGHPQHVPGPRVGHGDRFWNFGFVTLELTESSAEAKHFQVEITDEELAGAGYRVDMFYQETY